MEQWIGICIGKMHVYGISQSELASAMGIRRDYLCKILNGKVKPKGARERVEEALDELIKNIRR